VEIHMDLVEKILKAGLSKKAIYKFLVPQGYLRYRERG